MDLSEFRCRRCGTCCKWEGPVRVSQEEIARIAEFLHIDVQEFINNPVKPRQCSAFPFDWNFPGWEMLCEGGKELVK